jgi:hypothetical protein
VTFKASLATAISEVVKEGKFSTPEKGMSDELFRFIHLLMEKAGKPKPRSK